MWIFCVNWGVGNTLNKRWICVLRRLSLPNSSYWNLHCVSIDFDLCHSQRHRQHCRRLGEAWNFSARIRVFRCQRLREMPFQHLVQSDRQYSDRKLAKNRVLFFGWFVCFFMGGWCDRIYETVLMKLVERNFSATHIRTFLGRRKRRVKWKENAMRFFNNSLDVGFFTYDMRLQVIQWECSMQ